MAINGALEYIINHIGQEGYIKNSIQKILEYERNEEISKYEKKYNMNSRDFIKKFNDGLLEDETDYIDWFALIDTKIQTQKNLNSI